MKPFTSFLKMQLNTNYGLSALKYRFTREKKKLWEPILIATAIFFGLMPMLVLYTLLMVSMFAAGSALDPAQPEMILTISFLFSQVVILFFGLFYVMGTFYFSQDLESLVPLPLKPYEVIGGKFAVVMVNEYLTSMPILLPPLIIYGAGTGQGLLYWVKGLLLLLAAPVLPLAIASLIIMLLMRIVNFRRYKDFFAVIGGLAAMFIGIGFSLFMQNSVPEGSSQEFLKNLLSTKSGIINLIGSKYPPSIWVTHALSDNGLRGIGYLLLFLAACTLLFAVLMWLSNKVFYQSLLAGQEVTRKKKSVDAQQMDKQYAKVSNPVIALMKREWKLLFRTPIYLLNGLTGSIIGPIIILIMFFTKRSDADSMKLFDIINKPEAVPYVLLGGLGLMLFTAGMNVVASTSLSREGQTFWITKLIPVSAKQQVTAKLLVGYLVAALGVVITGVLMYLFLGQSVLPVLGISLVGLLGAIPMTALNLLLDIFHPKLIWNSEQEAMKQNMNSAIGMLLSLVILFILGFVTFILMMMKVEILFVLIAVGIVSAVLGALSILALYAVAAVKYKELEA